MFSPGFKRRFSQKHGEHPIIFDHRVIARMHPSVNLSVTSEKRDAYMTKLRNRASPFLLDESMME